MESLTNPRMKFLSSLFFLFAIPPVFAVPVVKGTANSLDSLVYCFDEKVGTNSVRYKVGFFGTGTSPDIILWRNKQQSSCTAGFTSAAEPIARGISSYTFNLIPDATDPEAVELSLQFGALSNPVRTTIVLRNLQ